MRFIHVYRIARLTPLTMILLASGSVLSAQEPASNNDVSNTDDELQPITVSDPRYTENFADEEPIDDQSFAEPAPSPSERLRSLFKLYRDAVADSMFAEADTLAKQIVELTIEINGLDSETTARAITNLAIAQHGNGDYASAKLNFQSAIDIVERITDRLNEDLINPLKGLAASELALGNIAAAAETFQRATHISHVNLGPHNLDQIELLESLAESYLAAGDLDEAIAIQERIFSLRARNVDLDSEDILPALTSQARWLHRVQMYDRERYTWRRVLAILEDHRGRDDLSLIAPLTGLGQSYLYISVPDTNYFHPTSNTTGEIYLKRALRIAEENPQSNWEIKTQAMIALADYYTLTDKPSRAERVYRNAWELLTANPDFEKQRTELLQSLQILQDIQPPRFYGVDSDAVPSRRIDDFESGTIVYQYSLSSRGKPTNITLLEAQPEVFDDMERAVARELRRFVQRPRVVDGNTVQTDNLTYTHNFFYRESDLPDATTAADTSQ